VKSGIISPDFCHLADADTLKAGDRVEITGSVESVGDGFKVMAEAWRRLASDAELDA